MEKQLDFNQAVRRQRIIAILRHLPADQVIPLFTALAEGGIRLVEITLNTTGALAMIKKARQYFQDDLVIGAGTVSTPDRARQALAAGASFLVTPNLDLAVIGLARQAGCPVLPGVMTPSEMVAAAGAGANTLKLFPASHLGPAYVRDVLAPLDELSLVAVGGVTRENAAGWLRAGCIGLGLGSSLFDKQLLAAKDYQAISRSLKSFSAELEAI